MGRCRVCRSFCLRTNLLFYRLPRLSWFSCGDYELLRLGLSLQRWRLASSYGWTSHCRILWCLTFWRDPSSWSAKAIWGRAGQLGHRSWRCTSGHDPWDWSQFPSLSQDEWTSMECQRHFWCLLAAFFTNNLLLVLLHTLKEGQPSSYAHNI